MSQNLKTLSLFVDLVEARSNSNIPVVALILYRAVVKCLPHSSASKILLMQYVSCFIWFPDWTLVISFRSINRLVFGIETQCVFSGVKPEVLNSGVWISGFIGKWDLLVRITMEPHFEVENLQRAYTIEIFESIFLE